MNNQLINRLNILGLLGITAILLMGSIIQLVFHELPCPLCLLQRVGFMMVMFGFMLNILWGPQQPHYGIILLGALFGATAALRQVSLHLLPNDLGYGSPLLGMHYYTWAFVIFVMTIIGVAVLLCLWRQEKNTTNYRIKNIGKLACYLAIIVVLINIISTFIMTGPHVTPADPHSYWLLDQFKK
ncbi:disulfide bond formation protein B [Photobacterium sp. S4TG1]|uniref:disulfide bond formation protein B n=1 Tax=Photobacterium sp. S4TG1 TaxID=3114587 RepID=UPI002E190683|nr:disulfide bond formation protein B [Photobacterium sp. S4TG1]